VESVLERAGSGWSPMTLSPMPPPIPTPPFDTYLLTVQGSLNTRTDRRGLNQHEHEDCIQEVLLIFIVRNKAGKIEDNIRMICGLAHLLYSQRAARIRYLRDRLGDILPDDDVIALASRYRWTVERMRDLEDCMASLPDDERVLVYLRYICGLIYRTIAKLVGDPQGTVVTTLGRALEKLRACMTKKGWGREDVA
jgi:RNA polymerase sigma factor (sigma-70 family)